MKRPLFVFAGQSNMVGACVYEAPEQIYYKNSYEYMHKMRRFGRDMGDFKDYGFPCGEFSYNDLIKAYGEGADGSEKSTLGSYNENAFFGPSVNDLEDDEKKTCHSFYDFSESNLKMSTSIAPYIIKELEENGVYSAFAHIAKGGVPIRYFLEGDAEKYFYEKAGDFFSDCEKKFSGDDMSEKCFVWLQGESDNGKGTEYYLAELRELWSRLKSFGFTKFFMIRVPFWSSVGIVDIMRAQELFCAENDDVYMLTRSASFIPWGGLDSSEWLIDVSEEYSFCRDYFYGFGNQHINDKGFRLVASHAVANILRIFEGKEPLLEDEKVRLLIEKKI